MSSAKTFVLYGRPACHLCDDMLLRLHEMLESGQVFEVEYIDIDARKELQALYGRRIPVLAEKKTGHEICQYHLDEPSFINFLSQDAVN